MRGRVALLRNLVIFASFSYLSYLLYLYDWEGGFKRGAILLFFLAVVFLDRRFSNRDLPDRGNSTALVMIVVFLSTWHINYFVDNIRSYPVDVGEMTVLSLNLLWQEQKNPYSQEVDDITEDGVGDHPGLFLKGYRYFPVTLLVYSPLVLAFGTRGLYLTNLLLHIITVILIYKIAQKLSTDEQSDSPINSIIIYLSSYLVLSEVFKQGVNDLIPTLLILASYYFYLQGRERSSAISLAASIAAKWLPGAILFVILIPRVKRKWEFLLLCSGTVLLLLLPFLLWDPFSFINSTITYFVLKAGDSTAFWHDMPPAAAIIVRLLLLALFFFVLVQGYKSRKQDRDGEILYHFLILTTALILFMRENHRNHIIWLIPLLSILLKNVNMMKLVEPTQEERI